MTAVRLNGLAMLSLEHKLTEEVDFSELIQEIAENEVRRASQ